MTWTIKIEGDAYISEKQIGRNLEVGHFILDQIVGVEDRDAAVFNAVAYLLLLPPPVEALISALEVRLLQCTHDQKLHIFPQLINRNKKGKRQGKNTWRVKLTWSWTGERCFCAAAFTSSSFLLNLSVTRRSSISARCSICCFAYVRRGEQPFCDEREEGDGFRV